MNDILGVQEIKNPIEDYKCCGNCKLRKKTTSTLSGGSILKTEYCQMWYDTESDKVCEYWEYDGLYQKQRMVK